jgi:acyltransferase
MGTAMSAGESRARGVPSRPGGITGIMCRVGQGCPRARRPRPCYLGRGLPLAALASEPSKPAAAEGRPRLAALDVARALGVLAMVMGHTLDAVLSPAARQTPAMIQYWHARGLTAPLFLLVSGWAVTLAIARSGAQGWDVPRGRARRVALLLAVGYALRWPGWAVDKLAAGDREVWGHLLAFDVLQCIAVVLLATSLVLALPWRAPAKAAVLSALGMGAAVLGAGAAMPGSGAAPALHGSLVRIAALQAVGGTSPFPVVPWAAYFFAGSVVGLLAPADRRGALGMGAVGFALVAITLQWPGMGERPPGDPVLIGFRIGVVLAVLAALELVPASAARRAAPLGRSSLGVYAIHLPVVYGWSTIPGLSWRVGPALSPSAGIGVAVLVLVASFAGYRGLAWAARQAVAQVRAAGGPRPA